MPTDRVLRDDTSIIQIVEKVLKSDVLLNKISKIIGEKTAEIIKCYQEKVDLLETKLEKAYEDIDALEQYSRRNNLRVYGIPETASENTNDIISSLCKNKFGLEIPSSSIDCSHRLGKVENGSRPILVKFCNRDVKQQIYNNKRKLKVTKTIIREDLTKKRMSLMKDVLKKCGSAWTTNCSIFAKHGNKVYKINSYNDLDKIVI
ncbi:l1 transposable element-related [Holotrichia oblita]|uniref:L1 transposable element-related n=1 Tax=Holotrichia oblita TaxID=644536 RepID=A0ACB9T3U4_HOLOL|nr:l1 transposable element-related [Holotrichia oblita]